jgi:translocon-associated protein subunit beta
MLSSQAAAAAAAAAMVSVRLHLMSLILLALLVFTAAVDNTAFLVVHKKATIQRVKGGERINVGITLYNAGSATAYDVSLTDDTWPSSLFSLVSGNTSQTWDKLEAGGSLSHSFIVESRIKGPFSGSPAVVKYRVASKSTLQEAFSTPLPVLDILSDKPAEKKYDWVKKLAVKYGPLVIVLTIVGLFIYLLITPSKSAKYSRLNKKRR